MRIYAGDRNNDTWQHLQLRCNGLIVPFCLWFDTELGMAECSYGQYIKRGPCQNSFVRILWTPEQEVFTYTLHNFEVWDMRTNQCVAKV